MKQHKHLYMRFSAECKYDLAFKDNRDGVETNTSIYHRLMIKNHDKIKEIEIMGYKFWMPRELIIAFHNSKTNKNPEYEKKHERKPIYINKILELIDGDQQKIWNLLDERREDPVEQKSDSGSIHRLY